MIEHPRPTPATRTNVIGAAHNQCAFPGCSKLIFSLEDKMLLGTVAHIKARRENGPRFDPKQSPEENRSFGNLVAMCGDHSKIIDGPEWKTKYPTDKVQRWKKEHEERIAKIADRSWLRPPSQLIKMDADGTQLRFSFWVDSQGRPQIVTTQQLATLNTLMCLDLAVRQVGSLPERLHQAANATVEVVLQQSWAKFSTERSVLADLIYMMAMVPNVTFAEFLGFVKGNDPTSLLEEAGERLTKLAQGEAVPLVRQFFGVEPVSIRQNPKPAKPRPLPTADEPCHDLPMAKATIDEAIDKAKAKAKAKADEAKD